MPSRSAPSVMQFAFSHHRLDAGTCLITVDGELELASAPSLKRELAGLLRAGHSRFVIDFSGVTFFDSTALGVLVGFSRNLTPSGILAIAAPSPPVLKIFEVTGLDRTFHLLPTVDAALAHVQQAPLPNPWGDVHASLTEDAAVVLGIASTAMPFAQSPSAQAERWLRALRRSGDAGIVLMALGTGDDPSETASQASLEDEDAQGLASGEDVYGPTFDRVLARYGIDADELTEQLGLS